MHERVSLCSKLDKIIRGLVIIWNMNETQTTTQLGLLSNI